jgi:hypothetical protein
MIDVADAVSFVTVGGVGEREGRSAQSDAIDHAAQVPLQRIALAVKRELDARRSAVDGQKLRRVFFHVISYPVLRTLAPACTALARIAG